MPPGGQDFDARYLPFDIEQWLHPELPDTTPPTPAQSAFDLEAGAPLRVAIPELGPGNMLNDKKLDVQIVGHTITINATVNYHDAVTATIYGPTEMLLPLGALESGDYTLVLNIDSSHEGLLMLKESEYIHFHVDGSPIAGFSVVPEPTSLTLAASALAALAVLGARWS
jgi:hypothetical protein